MSMQVCSISEKTITYTIKYEFKESKPYTKSKYSMDKQSMPMTIISTFYLEFILYLEIL